MVVRRAMRSEWMPMRRLVVGMLAVVMVGLPATSVAHARGGSSTSTDEPELLERECGPLPPGISVRIDCHWLVVPEDRDAPKSQEIKLAVAVMHSLADDPEPDPVVFLAGGPGGAAIETLENFVTSPMLETRDLVLFDQRGTGLSEPSLDCPERVEVVTADLSRAESHEFELVEMGKATVACRKRLEREGIDLSAYNTEANAADVAALRVALGIDEWNLYGVSYGTRLALATMRSHPEGIRSVVLDSVYPTDVGALEIYTTGAAAAFERLVDACNVDSACSVQQAGLGETVAALVDKYNETPAEITISTGKTLLITGDDIYAGVFDAMQITESIPTLPAIIESIADGDTGLLEVQAEQGVAAVGTPMKGMFLSMECADTGHSGGAATRAAQRAAGTESPATVIVRFAAQPYCDDWNVESLPRSFRRPVRSKIPALVLAGSLDPITPASDSKRAARTLKNATYVEFAGYGHVVTNGTDCPRAIRQAFLDDPGGELEANPVFACADEPAPAFLTQGLI